MGSQTKRVVPLVLGLVALLAAALTLALLDSSEETPEANPTLEEPEAAQELVWLEPAAPPTSGRNAEATSLPAPRVLVSEGARGTTLVVVDEAGARVSADVVVRAFDAEQRFAVEASADPVRLAMGRLPVRIEARTATAAGELVLQEVPTDPAVSLTVRPLSEWTGIVVDSSGQPVNPGVRVAVFDRRHSTEAEPMGVGWTASDGSFVVRGLPTDAPLLAHVGGAGYVGQLDGYPVTLGEDGVRLEAEYLFGVAIDGGSYPGGGEVCSLSKGQGVVMVHVGPELDLVLKAHPGIAHVAEAWNLFDPNPFRQILLVGQERAYPAPSVRAGVRRRGLDWNLEEVPLQRALEQIVPVRLTPALAKDGETPRIASLELQFAPPAGIERLPSNQIVGEVAFLYEEHGLEGFPLRRDDLLQGMVLTCLPEGPARFSVNLAGGAAPQTSDGARLISVVLSSQRTMRLVDLSQLQTLEVEATHPEFGPVLGSVSLVMGQGEVSSGRIARGEVDVRETYTNPPYLVFGLRAGDHWVALKGPLGQSRPVDLRIPSGGGVSTILVELLPGQ